MTANPKFTWPPYTLQQNTVTSFPDLRSFARGMKLRDEFQAAREHASELRFDLGTRYDQVRDGQTEWPTLEMLQDLGLAERAANQKWIELSAFVDAAFDLK